MTSYQLKGWLTGLTFAWVLLVLASIAAWITHVVVCLKTGAGFFLIAGAIVAPVGVIHGIGVWFGAW